MSRGYGRTIAPKTPIKWCDDGSARCNASSDDGASEGSVIGEETQTPLAVLSRVFGYSSFRGQQQTIIEHVVAGGDAIVLMPTGGGKSLCYQLPALLRPGLGVVVSPLIALMKDQVDALRQAGVRAAAMHSGLPPGEAGVGPQACPADAPSFPSTSPGRLGLRSLLPHS